MLSQIHFADHAQFHRQVAFASLGAGLSGLLIGSLAFVGLVGSGTWNFGWAALWLVGLGFSGALGVIGRSGVPAIARGFFLYAVLSAVGLGLSVALGIRYPALAWAIGGLALGLLFHLRQPGWLPRLSAGLLGIPFLLLASWVAGSYAAVAMRNDLLPLPLIGAMAGALGGFVLSAGLGLGQLRLLRDPLAQRFAQAQRILTGERRAQAAQARELYKQIQDDSRRLGLNPAIEQDILTRSGALCESLLVSSTRWQDLAGQHRPGQVNELRARIEKLERSAAEAQDPEASAQYLRASQNLSSQIDYLTSISRGGERTLARQVAQLALLEKVRFSLLSYQASDSERLAEQWHDIGQELDDLTGDVDLIGQSYRTALAKLQAASAQ